MHPQRILIGIVSLICVGMAVFFAVALLMYGTTQPVVILYTVFGLLFLLTGIGAGYVFFTRSDEKYRLQDEKDAVWMNKHPIATWFLLLVGLAATLYGIVKILLESTS